MCIRKLHNEFDEADCWGLGLCENFENVPIQVMGFGATVILNFEIWTDGDKVKNNLRSVND